MDDEPNWVELQQITQTKYRDDLLQMRKRGPAEEIFFGSALRARQAVLNDYSARIDADGGHYRLRQGLDATIHTREDVIALMNMALPTIKLVNTVKQLAWVAIALLAYIAYKVS